MSEGVLIDFSLNRPIFRIYNKRIILENGKQKIPDTSLCEGKVRFG